MLEMIDSIRHTIPFLTMQQAMTEHEEFDVLIIDEADECIFEPGATVDHHKERFVGFWDLLKVKSILLTATAGISIQDTLFECFGLRKESFLTFKHLIGGEDVNACRTNIRFNAVKTEKDYWDKIQSILEQ